MSTSAPIKPINILGNTIGVRFPAYSIGAATNLFVEAPAPPPPGMPVDNLPTSAIAWFSMPGLTQVATYDVTAPRGICNTNDLIYLVCGNQLLSIDKKAISTSPVVLGTLGKSTGPASMSYNGSQLMIADQGDGYILYENPKGGTMTAQYQDPPPNPGVEKIVINAQANQARITTNGPHFLQTGRWLTLTPDSSPTDITLSGDFPATRISDTTFTVPLAKSNGSSSFSTTGSYTVPTWSTIAGGTHAWKIRSMQGYDNIVTVNTQKPHGMEEGQIISVAGMVPDDFNTGPDSVITVDSATSFSYFPKNAVGITNPTTIGSYTPVDTCTFLSVSTPPLIAPGMYINVTTPDAFSDWGGEKQVRGVSPETITYNASKNASSVNTTPLQYTVTNPFANLNANPGFLSSSATVVSQGRTVNLLPGTQRFQYSQAFNAGVYNALDFAEAEFSSDPLTAIASMGPTLVLFGSRSTEFWTPAANQYLPWAPAQDSALNVGCLEPQTVVSASDEIIFLGVHQFGQRSVFALKNFQLSQLSTPEADAVLQTLSQDELEKITALRWTHQGHQFYQLNLSATKGIIYDLTEQSWAWVEGDPLKVKVWLGGSRNYGVGSQTASLFIRNLNPVSTDLAQKTTMIETSVVSETIFAPDYKQVSTGIVQVYPPEATPTLTVSLDLGATWEAVSLEWVVQTGRAGVWRFLGLPLANSYIFKIAITSEKPFIINGLWAAVG